MVLKLDKQVYVEPPMAIPPSFIVLISSSYQLALFAISTLPVNLMFFVKLDQTNYLLWCEQVLSIVIAYELDVIINPYISIYQVNLCTLRLILDFHIKID